MPVLPTELEEVISVTSAMVPRWRSRGVATVVAIVSGLAPAMDAWTWIVGWSTWGSGDTGRLMKAVAPARTIPEVKRVVATGLRMKTSEKFMSPSPPPGPAPPPSPRSAPRSGQT